MSEIYKDASKVGTHQGAVTVDGPDGVAVTLTPEAADETAHRLIDKSLEAAGQRHFARNNNGGEEG